MGTGCNRIIIDRNKCDGCGLCVAACPGGAIQLVDGKAMLVDEDHCDGLGACIGECPRGAITVGGNDSPVASPDSAPPKEEPASPCGAQPEKADPGPGAWLGCGCPGTLLQAPVEEAPATRAAPEISDPVKVEPWTGNWPVQLRLVPPMAQFLKGAHLLLCADCAPVVLPDFRTRYADGRVVLVGCPKLDDGVANRARLKAILEQADLASLTVVRMEVPCCTGLANMARSLRNSIAPQLPMEIHTVGIRQGVTVEKVPPMETGGAGGAGLGLGGCLGGGAGCGC